MSTPSKDDAKLFEAILIELYGDRYKFAAARELEVHRMTIDRWVNAEYNIAPAAWDKLQVLVSAKLARVKKMIEDQNGREGN